MKTLAVLFACLLSAHLASAKEIQTNSVHMADAPAWVTTVRTEKIINHIQQYLEWDIRRIEVTWHSDQKEFERFHGLGPTVLAISRREDNTIHLGPRIDDKNFDQVFGHELVHIISFQKYKKAIPLWLEEGLANTIAKAGTVDYAKLASEPVPADVRQMTHPFGGTEAHIHYHYMASQALVEMIAKKCDLSNLLRLSVGKNIDSYLGTYCEIPDLNAAFRSWVQSHAPPGTQVKVGT